MFVDTLKGMTSIFDRRFLMHVFFPCLVFWGLLFVVWFTGAEGLFEAVRRWRGQEGFDQAVEAVCFVVAVYLFSIMLVGKMRAILQFYEGYWDFSGSRYLKEYGKARHQRILKKLSYDTISYNYPMRTREVMPTRLGNILKNAELYPTDRYQIDAVQVWPRLYGLLPENLVQAMGPVQRRHGTHAAVVFAWCGFRAGSRGLPSRRAGGVVAFPPVLLGRAGGDLGRLR